MDFNPPDFFCQALLSSSCGGGMFFRIHDQASQDGDANCEADAPADHRGTDRIKDAILTAAAGPCVVEGIHLIDSGV